MTSTLIQKYNIPGPRYTSYPTVPYWRKEGIKIENWITSAQKTFSESNASEGISIYIHLPFCESLCTFCACHKRITKRHSIEQPYILCLKSGIYIVIYFPKNLALRNCIQVAERQHFSPLRTQKSYWSKSQPKVTQQKITSSVLKLIQIIPPKNIYKHFMTWVSEEQVLAFKVMI